ncbi:MAG: hypothetical protein IPL56_00675 [Saprospiraceae bacterium]|nr:hypothetical protein [Saprospiraceae bacterium]
MRENINKFYNNKLLNIFVFCLLLLFGYLFESYTFCSILLFVYFLFLTIDSYGNSINIFRILGLYSIIIYLIAPIIGYYYFNIDNEFSAVWVMYMPIIKEQYFVYIFPAIIFFLLGIEIVYKEELTQKAINVFIESTEKIQNNTVGLKLIISGILALVFLNYVPQIIQYEVYIIFLFFFTGILYYYFKPKLSIKDILVLILSSSWILLTALKSTMFTIVIYMGMTISAFVVIKFSMRFGKKLLYFILLSVIVLNIQFSKMAVRNAIYYKKSNETTILFLKTFVNNISLIGNNLKSDVFFPIYVRINQGRLTAHVLKYIPKSKEIDNGERLFLTIFSSFVPRFIWPNKPQAGGKYNMKYYANMNTEKASMNVGPLGEAYGSFGALGGIVYMFLYGVLLSGIFRFLTLLTIKKPLLLLWIPIIFFQAIYSMETDTMQALNSIIKISFFLWILFKLFPSLLEPKQSIDLNYSKVN